MSTHTISQLYTVLDKAITMSDIVTPIETLLNDNLKQRLASQIALEDWTDECSKCGYPKLLHKDHVLHRDATCTRGAEVPNILKEN